MKLTILCVPEAEEKRGSELGNKCFHKNNRNSQF